MATALLVAVAGPAQAVACGGAAQNDLTITARHDTTFYTDLGAGFDAAYLAYSIANSGSARSNLWVRVNNFTGGSVTLADTTADRQQIASLAGAASATAFFLTKASTLSSAAQTHTISVYDRRPDLTGASVLATCDFSFTSVANTIGANANKVTAIASTPASPQIGQTVTVTVDGQTGTTSGAMWVSPASSSLWPAKALRLESTLLEVNTNGTGAVEETYTNSLFIPSAQASLYTSQTTYRATYVFRVTGATSSNPTIKPVAQISSGGQFKHTGSFPTLPTISASTAAASITMTKAIVAGSLLGLPTTTAPNGGAAGGVTYAEVPYKVEGTAVGGATAVVDEFVDIPATGVLFKAGSAVLTDTTRTTTAVADPVTSPSDTGALSGALHFTGPFTASGATTAAITYTMYVPLAVGTYTNQAYATINDTTIGTSPGAVPTVTVTADGTALTGWTPGTSVGSAPTPQSITFAQPTDVPVTDGTRSASATSTSGLAVAFTSSTTSVCTVIGTTVTLLTAGTCTINADQAGNGSYAPAGTVTRSFIVIGSSQAITFAQPTDVPVADGTRSVSATSDSGLAVAFTSSTPLVCTVSGTTVTLLTAGICTIDADQAGNATYAAASTLTRSFTVLGSQTITFAQPSDVRLSVGTRSVSATSDSGLTVAFTSTTTGVCTVTGTTVTLLTVGTCTIDADQAGNASYAAAGTVTRSFAVTVPPRAAQEITFEQPSNMSISAGTHQVSATSSASLRVVLTSLTPSVCTVTGTTITLAAMGACTIQAAQAGDADYQPTALTRTFQVTAPAAAPDASPLVSSGTGTAAQSASAAIPADGSVTLLDPTTQAPTHTVTVSGQGIYTLTPTTGIIVFAPALGFIGTATPVTYQVTNAVGLKATATYTPTVLALVAPPSVGRARQGEQITLTPTVVTGAPDFVLGTLRLLDPDGTPVSTLSVPAVGTYSIDPDPARVTFTPAPTFIGTYKATYRVQDDAGNVTQSTLDVHISALVITADSDTINPGQTGHARLNGVPEAATVTLDDTVKGASKVTYSGGQVHAVSTTGFTGRIRVPVTILNGTATIHLTAVITVRPHAPTRVRHHVVEGGDTVITWRRPAGPQPEAYTVRVGKHRTCHTTTRTCTVKNVVAGPKTAVTVVAVGGNQVTSPTARGVYRAQGCVSIGAVYFATDSAELSSETRRELKRVARILGPRGFTRACLVGHTDNSADNEYNLNLSRRRVAAVAAYLHERARRVRYATSHVGEEDPARPNTTTNGQAANRRVEIGVA